VEDPAARLTASTRSNLNLLYDVCNDDGGATRAKQALARLAQTYRLVYLEG
jgi:hypothetical protein